MKWILLVALLGHCHSVQSRSHARRHLLSQSQPRQTCSSMCIMFLLAMLQVRRSLDDESVKTLVHAFVIAWVDCCNMVLASSPRSVTDKLQRVLNAAARLVSGMRKYDRGLSQILHADLHWVDVADQVRYKLSVIVYQSPQQSAAVSGRLLRSSLRHRQSSATTFCTSLLADHTTPST